MEQIDIINYRISTLYPGDPEINRLQKLLLILTTRIESNNNSLILAKKLNNKCLLELTNYNKAMKQIKGNNWKSWSANKFTLQEFKLYSMIINKKEISISRENKAKAIRLFGCETIDEIKNILSNISIINILNSIFYTDITSIIRQYITSIVI